MKAIIDYINSKEQDSEQEVDFEIGKCFNRGDYIYIKDEYEEELELKVNYKWFNLIENRLRIDTDSNKIS